MTATPATIRPGPPATLRVCGIIILIATIGQPLSAGLFVTGDVGMLLAHSIGSVVIFLGAAVYLVTGILAARRGIGNTYLWAGLGFTVVVLAQIAVGTFRVLWLHFPLGVVMAVGAYHLVAVAGRPAVRAPR